MRTPIHGSRLLAAFIIAAVILFLTPAATTAKRAGHSDTEALHRAIDHLERKEFIDAYEILMPMALQGDAEAQFQIGWMYRYGQGLPQNACLATVWHDKAARQGHGRAQHSMAFSYFSRDGLMRDYELAYRWLRQAIRNGIDVGEVIIEMMAEKLSPWLKQRIENTVEQWRPDDQPPADVLVIPDRVGGRDYSNRSFYDYGHGSCIPDFSGTSIERFGPRIYRPFR